MRTALAGSALAAIIALTACTLWKEPRRHTWQSATGAEQYERLLWEEVRAGNWALVRERLAATFVSVSPSGVRDRDAFLERLRQLPRAGFAISELEVRPSGPDMIVTYTLQWQEAGDSATMPSTRRMLTVWQQLERGWIAIAHAEMPLGSAQQQAPAQ